MLERNVVYILDEETEEQQQNNAIQELKQALKGQVKELYKPKEEVIQESLA